VTPAEITDAVLEADMPTLTNEDLRARLSERAINAMDAAGYGMRDHDSDLAEARRRGPAAWARQCRLDIGLTDGDLLYPKDDIPGWLDYIEAVCAIVREEAACPR